MRCQVKGCRKESFVVYYNKDVCKNHWEKFCDEKINLKKVFNIKEVEIISALKYTNEIQKEYTNQEKLSKWIV